MERACCSADGRGTVVVSSFLMDNLALLRTHSLYVLLLLSAQKVGVMEERDEEADGARWDGFLYPSAKFRLRQDVATAFRRLSIRQ